MSGRAASEAGFAVDPFSGAATLSLPLIAPAGRTLEPSLRLEYDSRAPNGPCGLGLSLSLRSIARYTGGGVPTYGPEDSFSYGDEILVALGEPATVELASGAYAVSRYAPRADSAPARIERWERIADGEACWRRIERDGVACVYGLEPAARIADPADPTRVFEWLPQYEYDTHGEAIAYEWLAEDGAGVATGGSEAGRDRSAQRYLGAVRYAPWEPVAAPAYGIGPWPSAQWHFALLCDYGQYAPEPSNPQPQLPSGAWATRLDPRSSHRSGFEVRTHRLLRGVLLFHEFEGLGPTPMLTQLVRLSYDESPLASRLIRVDTVSCAPDPDGTEPYAFEPLPPIELSYTERDLGSVGFTELEGAPPWLSAEPVCGSADLAGEGASGALYADGESVRWSPPAPGGRGFGPASTPASFPLERRAWGGAALADVDGDGLDDLLVTGARAGAYPATENGFGPFAPFSSRPTELSALTALADLSGDGLPDAVVLERGLVRVYPGQGSAGFGAGAVRAAPASAPPSLDGGGAFHIGFADVLGSGAAHLVRVGEGSLECWPSLGYGVFGERLTLADAPSFDGEFDPARVLLADLSGNGCADLLYVTSERLLVHLNEAGNGFSAPVELALPVALESPARLGLCELDGSGIPAVVVGALGGPPRHWASEPGARPGLLCGVVNSLGAETTLTYTSAAECRLADAAAGRDWVGRLPFALEVVSSVREWDALNGSGTETGYSYHHGFYSPQDRALGFGLVERRETPLLEPRPGDPAALAAGPPRLLRTWFATGAFPDHTAALEAKRFDGDPQAWELPATAFDWGRQPAPADGETARQARAALRGRVVREELYGLDGTAAAVVPYRVEQWAFGVRLVQARGAGPWAAFLVSEREALRTEYERDAGDPVVHHGLTLEIDEYGSPLLSAAVAYPRRADPALPEQEMELASCEIQAYANIDSETSFRVGIPTEAIERQLEGLPAPASGPYGFEEIAAHVRDALAGRGGLTAPVRAGRRQRYYAAGGAIHAPPGEAGPEALLRTETFAVVADADARAIFKPALDAGELAARLEAAHHRLDPETGLWWARGDVNVYAPPAGFQRLLRSTNPAGASVHHRYDATAFALRETRERAADTLDRTLTVSRFDYRALVPARVEDANGRVVEDRHDAHGEVVLSTSYGFEAGQPAGFAAILDKRWQAPGGAAELIADPGRFIGAARETILSDHLAWAGRVRAGDLAAASEDPTGLLAALASAGYLTPEGVILAAFRALAGAGEMTLPPPYAADAAAAYAALAARPPGVPARRVRVAANEYPGRAGPAPRIEVTHFDGSGRPLQQRLQAEPAAGAERWAISEAVRYDGDGAVRLAHPPSFGTDWAFATGPSLGPPAVHSYDALARPVRCDTAKGLLTTTAISAWTVTHADEVDTVLESPYWAAHGAGQGIGAAELEALRGAALSAGTPTVLELDPLGHPVAEVALLNRTLSAADVASALGLDPPTAAQLYGELRAAGMLDFRAALTTAFQPESPGFSLGLSPALAPHEAAAIALLRSLLGGGVPLRTRHGRDLAGRPLWSADPRLTAGWEGDRPGATSSAVDYSFSGFPLRLRSADGGERLRLPDHRDRDVWLRDARGVERAVSRDPLGRVLTVAVTEPGAPAPRTVEAHVYGDQLSGGAPVAPEPGRNNLVGRRYRSFDGAGAIEYGYDLDGEEAATSRWLLADPAAPVDWSAGSEHAGPPALEPTAWTARRRHDANGLVVEETDEAGARHEWERTRSGWVGAASVAPPGEQPVAYVTAVEYDPAGRREAITYGNGAVTTYAYDPLDQRLVEIATSAGGALVQSLSYASDPVGNLAHVGDGALATLLGGLGTVSPDRAYAYDSLYRLVRAEGPELAALAAASEAEPGFDGLALPGEAPAAALADATRSHAYDAAGNLYWSERAAAGAAWTAETLIAADSNRGLPAELCGLTPAPPGDAPAARPLPAAAAALFDADGNQLQLDAEAGLGWDHADRLASSSSAARAVLCAYDAGDGLVRELVAAAGGAIADVLHFPGVQVTRATAPGSAATMETRTLVRDDSALVAEALHAGSGSAHTAYDLGDLSGSVAVRLGPAAELRSYEAFAPYGGTAFALLPDPDEAGAKRERYAQRRRDRALGTYDFDRRHFAPWSGRWLSPDPSGDRDGLNLYAYVGDNPTSAVDRDGRERGKVDRKQGGKVKSGGVRKRSQKPLLPSETIRVNTSLSVTLEADALLDELRQTTLALKQGVTKLSSGLKIKTDDDPMEIDLGEGRGMRAAQETHPKLGDVNHTVVRKLGKKRITVSRQAHGPFEPGVLLTSVPRDKADGTGEEMVKAAYGAMTLQGRNAHDEGSQLRAVITSKRPPRPKDPNDDMALVMNSSELQRGWVAGVESVQTAYLVKEKEITMEQGFHGKDPVFPLAKSSGGAQQAKRLEAWFNDPSKLPPPRFRKPAARLQFKFYRTLIRQRQDLFTQARTAGDVHRIVRETPLRWWGLRPSSGGIKKPRRPRRSPPSTKSRITKGRKHGH
jgi:RHS repeat-associated protein